MESLSSNDCSVHYADEALCITAKIVYHETIAVDTRQIGFECPDIAKKIVPGQFLMIRLHGRNDPLIGRALAMYDRSVNASGEPYRLDVVYLVKGKFTQSLAASPIGTELDVWGPLGNGFSTAPVERLILVAGGVGQTPMLTLGQEALGLQSFGGSDRIHSYAEKVTFCYGARTASRLAGIPDFLAAGFDLRIATDDGSRLDGGVAEPSLVTDRLREVLEESTGETRRISCCGPEPMMEAVAKLANAHGVACEVSLETPMACGIGICFTCVAKIRDACGEWDYKRTCVEGPIFNAANVVW